MKSLRIAVGVTAILMVLFFSMDFYNKRYYRELYKKPKMYPYETYFGPANSVLIIEDLKYKDNLVMHYDYMEKYRRDTTFSFPLKTLPQTEPVYVLGYSEDSLVAEVVSLYYRGAHFGGDFTQGYVATKTLHLNPPPDSLMPGKYKRPFVDSTNAN